MKRIINAVSLFLLTAAAAGLLNGCRKPCRGESTCTYFVPEYTDKAVVKANIKSNAPQAVKVPGKIYIYGNYIFLNEVDKGLHVIDNSNPAAPVNRSFINLPGNVDIAIRGNLLYADFYSDLVVMDISNPLDVKVKNFVDRIFPERYYRGYSVDSTRIITGWNKKTVTQEYSCDDEIPVALPGIGVAFVSSMSAMDAGFSGVRASNANAAPTGISGSMARFALINDYLYTVSFSSLRSLSLAAPLQPQQVNNLHLGWGIETIYPFKDRLFIGSSRGMYICSLQNPAAPVLSGTFTHATACDPVIADDNTAYVTLRSGAACTNTVINQMDILDVRNINAPALIRSYPLTNPAGLGKDGNLLFVCDGATGVRVFNAANPAMLVQTKLLAVPNAADVILNNGVALIVSPGGLHQYDYSNGTNIRYLSTIPVEN